MLRERAVHKSSQSGGEGVLQIQTSALFGEHLDFLKFMVCPHGQGRRGLRQCGHFADKEGSIFRDFVRTSFTDGPLAVYDFDAHIMLRVCSTFQGTGYGKNLIPMLLRSVKPFLLVAIAHIVKRK